MVQNGLTTLPSIAAIALVAASCGPRLQGPAPVATVRVSQLDELPVPLQWPPTPAADSGRPASLSGVVTIQCVIDTAGRLVKDLILVISDAPGRASRHAEGLLRGATFSRPRVNGEPRRALIEIAIDLTSGTAVVAPRLSDRIAWLEDMVDDKPEVLSGPMLHYPDEARKAGITGRVIVQAILSPDGHAEPATVRVIQGVHHDLNFAAIAYVRRALFKPARIAGRPVRTLVNLPIDFKIRRRR